MKLIGSFVTNARDEVLEEVIGLIQEIDCRRISERERFCMFILQKMEYMIKKGGLRPLLLKLLSEKKTQLLGIFKEWAEDTGVFAKRYER